MPLLTTGRLAAGASALPGAGMLFSRANPGVVKRAASRIISEYSDPSRKTVFDIFLSHRKMDEDQLAVITNIFEKPGLTVFIDWKEYPEMDRSTVTTKAASRIRQAMHKSRALMFATTDNSGGSVWMP